MKSFKKLLVLLAVVAPVAAFAHPGHDGHELTWSFTGGLTHPFSGWDHLLAMIAVGVWASQLGKPARLALPLAFVAFLCVGAAIGQAGFTFGAAEQGIAASLLALGLLICSAKAVSLRMATPLVALFALFHGYAHGAEMPATNHGLSYAFGFAIASLSLHIAGLYLGDKTAAQVRLQRVAGALVALTGVIAFQS